ncbi:Detected protein of unknown function [Hibiscus syriacus]|uniref:TmcB/TmcC TPR repeats domain-containing protein n=1 Tax=Hibiscus syriacus TaxID=106335 RepID=A0A6A3CFP0_HIBSY|nr:Detected protein of unknown function [Hibiscus syriacus]
MKAAILRAGSVLSSALSGSPRVSLSRQAEGNSNAIKTSFLRYGCHQIGASSSRWVSVFYGGDTGGGVRSDCEVDSEFRTEFGISLEEIGFSGEGFGTGGKFGGDHGDDSYEDKRQIGDHYREMLKLNPGDSLLLRNYGKFLHEVEKDMDGAEAYYGRAILASPGDGEVLSLYGKLIWERHRDESRAKS